MRRSCRQISVLVALCAVIGGTPSAASAHASLETSSPADNAVLETAPAEVELRFTSPVTAAKGSVTVFGPDAKEAQTGTPSEREDGKVVIQEVGVTGPGTHAVAYRFTSDDGHTITGSLTYHVGTKSQAGDVARLGKRQAQIDRSVATGFAAARGVAVLCLLLAVGGAIFSVVLVPAWRPRYLVRILVILLAALGVSIVLDAALVQGSGVRDALTGDGIRESLTNPFGSATLVTASLAVLALAAATLVRSGGTGVPMASRAAVLLVFGGLAASLSLAGHAAVDEPVALRLPLDVAHVLAASIWIGGLLQLGAMAHSAQAHLEGIARFSRVAFASVMVLLGTGAYATFSELGLSPHELWDTQYGRLVLAKLVLYTGTMPLAWLNMTLYVPTVQRHPERASHLLRQYVWRELFLLVVVVGLTGWLITSDPTH